MCIKNSDSNDSLTSISWKSFDSRSNSLDSNSSSIANIMDFYKDNKNDNKKIDDISVKKKLEMAFEKPRRKREMNINYVLSKSPQISDAINIIEKGRSVIASYNSKKK